MTLVYLELCSIITTSNLKKNLIKTLFYTIYFHHNLFPPPTTLRSFLFLHSFKFMFCLFLSLKTKKQNQSNKQLIRQKMPKQKVHKRT